MDWDTRRFHKIYKYPKLGMTVQNWSYTAMDVGFLTYHLPDGQAFPYFKFNKVAADVKYDSNGQFQSDQEYAIDVSLEIPLSLSEETILTNPDCADPNGIKNGECTIKVNTKAYAQCLQEAYADLDNTDVKICEIAGHQFGNPAGQCSK